MDKTLVILGRQPKLGLAELESLFGAKIMRPVGSSGATLDLPPEKIPFERLGGSIKVCKLLNILNSANWRSIEDYLSEMIPKHLQYVPEGKFRLGLSVYGLAVRPQEINAAGLRLKKIIKSEGRSVRVVPNKSAALNSAQILHNQLTGPTGWELVLVRDGNKTLLGLTVAEQDIEAYTKRDQQRPMRDAKVGMLPPKLAQIIINLAAPNLPNTKDNQAVQEKTSGNVDNTPTAEQLSGLLDPFCGTGVILQEALLMGIPVIGTDLDKRMVQYSQDNIKWLFKGSNSAPSSSAIFQADATEANWPIPALAVASETYLGKPLTSIPPKKIIDQIRFECDVIHEKFLRNIARQIKPGTRLCLAVPAWKLKTSFLHLKTLDRLSELGYNRLSFVHANSQDLIYHRPDQTVARELVVLEKK